MLNNVTIAVNKHLRNVVLNHPNTMNCMLLRKVVTRIAPIAMGLPTIGGLGVISADDEDEIDYVVLGNGYAMPVDSFQPSNMMDRKDANNGFTEAARFLIEPENDLTHPNGFDIHKNDLMYVQLYNVRMGYEIIAMETVNNIPPYTVRYICNRRNELDTVI